jgi:hypothetical protein
MLLRHAKGDRSPIVVGNAPKVLPNIPKAPNSAVLFQGVLNLQPGIFGTNCVSSSNENPKRPNQVAACCPRNGLREDNRDRGINMKKLTMWLGCALTAFAIGCGDEVTKPPPAPPPGPVKMIDPAKVPGMTTKEAPANPADAEKKDGDAEKKNGDAEKKDGDAEKKDGDAEKKDGDTEKKDGGAEEK